MSNYCNLGGINCPSFPGRHLWISFSSRLWFGTAVTALSIATSQATVFGRHLTLGSATAVFGLGTFGVSCLLCALYIYVRARSLAYDASENSLFLTCIPDMSRQGEAGNCSSG